MYKYYAGGGGNSEWLAKVAHRLFGVKLEGRWDECKKLYSAQD